MDGATNRICSRCGARLRQSNEGGLCDPCARVGSSTEPAEVNSFEVPDGFYDRRDVATALTAYDFAAFLRVLRSELGLSQEALGLAIGLDQSRVCKIETGGQRLRDVVTIARLARAFGVPPSLLGFVSADGVTLHRGGTTRAVSWLERRDFLSVVMALSLGTDLTEVGFGFSDLVPAVDVDPLPQVGITDVERIEATTVAFRQWDNRWGGGLSRAAITAQLQWVTATARTATFTAEALRTRLLVATADLAMLAAWVNYDVEQHEDARRLWVVALDAARTADRPDLTGAVLSLLAHQALHLGRPEEALRLARLAYAACTDPRHQAPELAMTQIAAFESWSHALAGRRQAAERALGKAEEHFASSSGGQAPPWLTYFDGTELVALQGHVHHVLADHDPNAATTAEGLLRQVVQERRPEYARSRTLNRIALAATYFQRGEELVEGVAVGDQALAEVKTLNSPRVVARLRVLDGATRRYATAPVVAGFRERLRPVLTSAGNA